MSAQVAIANPPILKHKSSYRRLIEKIGYGIERSDLYQRFFAESDPCPPPVYEDYTLYIGKPRGYMPMDGCKNVMILHGKKSRTCRWTYCYRITGQWFKAQGLYPCDEDKCANIIELTKVCDVESRDLPRVDGILREAVMREGWVGSVVVMCENEGFISRLERLKTLDKLGLLERKRS
ncbi:hypothetical protein BDV19DRAFT_384076 [Aspergillus venezuelensis]